MIAGTRSLRRAAGLVRTLEGTTPTISARGATLCPARHMRARVDHGGARCSSSRGGGSRGGGAVRRRCSSSSSSSRGGGGVSGGRSSSSSSSSRRLTRVDQNFRVRVPVFRVCVRVCGCGVCHRDPHDRRHTHMCGTRLAPRGKKYLTRVYREAPARCVWAGAH